MVLCGIEISVLRIRVHELLDLYVRMQHRTCYGRAVCVCYECKPRIGSSRRQRMYGLGSVIAQLQRRVAVTLRTHVITTHVITTRRSTR